MNDLSSLMQGIGFVPAWVPVFGLLFVVLVFWTIFWKGLALWHSARRGESLWFITLLVVNTAGILEIIYLLFVKKIKLSELFK